MDRKKLGQMKRRFFIMAFVFLGSLLVISLILLPVQAQARNIKVGVIDCYSGPPAPFAKDALNGFKLALSEINKKGVLGKKIEVTTRDTKFKVDIGLSVAKELVMREGVDILAGVLSSSVALAVSDAVAKKNRVPLIVWIAKSEKITGSKGHRYVFSAGENTAMAGKSGAVVLAKKPFTRYWIAGDDYEYGHAIANATWRYLKAMKPDVKVIGQSWWKVGEPDLTPYFTAIMAAKPDTVIWAGGGKTMSNLMKMIKTTGMLKQMPLWSHSATDHAILRTIGAAAPEGMMGTMDYHFYHPDTPANRAFVGAFEAAYGVKPGFPAFHGYMTGHFIAKAYRKAGSTDTEKFIDALEGLKIASPVGEVEMRACDHQVVLPMFLGTTKKVSQYKHLIAGDIVTLKGEDILPSCDEVREARGK